MSLDDVVANDGFPMGQGQESRRPCSRDSRGCVKGRRERERVCSRGMEGSERVYERSRRPGQAALPGPVYSSGLAKRPMDASGALR